MVRVNNLKPILMAATRPAKIKRSASSRIPKTLTSTGEDLLTKKKAGEALTVETPAEGENQETKAREPASALYAVSEIRGTAGSLIAKLISKKTERLSLRRNQPYCRQGIRSLTLTKTLFWSKSEKIKK